MVDSTSKTVRVRQVGSPIRRNGKQLLHLKSLGLRGIGSERELVVNNTVLGLLRKTRHMVVEIDPVASTKNMTDKEETAGKKATAVSTKSKGVSAEKPTAVKKASIAPEVAEETVK
jgi:large subunit ribosomal protein L30